MDFNVEKTRRTVKALFFAAVLVPKLAFAFVDPAPPVPDPVLTPGDWHGKDGNGTPTPLTILCVHDWSEDERDVPKSMKNRIFASYHIKRKDFPKGTFEVDHRMPLALDGKNSAANLWIQSFVSSYNAHMKDHLEDVLHRAVCRKSHPMPLMVAQQAFIGDWRIAFDYYVTNKHWKDNF